MKGENVKEAIVLKCQDLFDKDRIVTFLSPAKGRFEAVSRGSRKLTSRTMGKMEPMNLLTFRLNAGRSLDSVTEAEIICSFSGIRQSLPASAAGLYMMDVINRQSAEGEENRPLFSLAKGCLRLLEGGLSPQVVSCFFEIKFVKVMGYMPSLHRCAACEGPGDHLYMSYRRGGGICPKCLGTSGRDQGMEVSPGTLQILRFMARTAARHLPTLNIHPSVLSQAREYLKCHMEHNLPGRPAAIKEYEKLSG